MCSSYAAEWWMTAKNDACYLTRLTLYCWLCGTVQTCNSSHGGYESNQQDATPQIILDIWLAVHHSITFLLLPTWYTNFLFIHTNYIKLNSCTCFEYSPLIIRRSTMQIVESFLSSCTRRSLAESDDTRGCICTICVVDLLMMSGLRSKHVQEFNFM